MRLKFLIIAITALCTFFSCSSDRLNNNMLYETADIFYKFPGQDTLEFIKLYEFVDDVPKRIFDLDSLLLINTYGQSKEYWLYLFSKKENKIIKKFLKYGRGPNESLSLFATGISHSDSLWTYDIMKKEIYKAPLVSIVKDRDVKFARYPVDEYYYQIDFMQDSIYLGTGNELSGNKMSFVNLYNQHKFLEKGEFYSLPDNLPIAAVKDAFTSYISIKPDGNKVVLAYRYTDVIEIFDQKGILQNTVQGPGNFMSEFELSRGDIARMRKTKETRKAFVSLLTTNNYIYLLYSGNTRESEEWSSGRFLFVYNWDGKPIKSFYFDTPVDCLGIDEKTMTFYSYNPMESSIIYAHFQL